MTDQRIRLLNDLYAVLDDLTQRCGGRPLVRDCDARRGWPGRGVYFFFQPDEARENGRPRVVRVGTHALSSKSRTTLWVRLSQHRGTTGGTMPGGGNHRGSIFRLHVGAALLARGGWPEELKSTWGHNMTAPREIREAEYDLERAVSTYIGNMSLLCLAVDDPPGPTSERGVIEAGAIAALSNRWKAPADPPSDAWLGRHSMRAEIRESGLWNVQHVDEVPSATFLDVLSRWVVY